MVSSEVIRCTRCILPNTLSGIEFDEEGVCSYCRKYEKDFSNWDSIKGRKKKEFEDLLSAAKKLKRPYDCLVPLSGGKDSTYVLYLCAKVYSLRCLTVTFDNGFLTTPAKDNIAKALEATGADHFYYHINKKNSFDIYKHFMTTTGDFCSACMRGINYSIESAVKLFNAPLIINGSGRRVEYLDPIAEISRLHTPSYIGNVLKRDSVSTRFSHLSWNKVRLEYQKGIGAICDIAKIPRTKVMRFCPQHLRFYDYIYTPYNEIVSIIEKEMGWTDSGGKIEHLDCVFHDIPLYMHTLNIPGITPETCRNSALIRQGILKRDDAIDIENKYKNNNPPDELEYFLKQTDMKLEEFKEYSTKRNGKEFEPRLQKIIRKLYYKLRKL